jgi:hypothetical protein
MTGADLLAGSCTEADPAVASVILYQYIPEGYPAQECAGGAVVKDSQTICAQLASVHEKVIERPSAQPHPLQQDRAPSQQHG